MLDYYAYLFTASASLLERILNRWSHEVWMAHTVLGLLC